LRLRPWLLPGICLAQSELGLIPGRLLPISCKNGPKNRNPQEISAKIMRIVKNHSIFT
jgi:hypothetical protein